MVVLGEHVHDRLHTFLHALFDGFLGVQFGVLLQIADAVTRREDHVALVVFLDSCDDLEERGFAGAVEADDTYLGSVEEAEVDVVKDLFLRRESFAHADH